jgi:inhibitor of cysteine peptidase
MNGWRAAASFGAIVAVMAVAAWAGPAGASMPAQREVTVTEEANGSTVTLSPGDDLTISLSGNPTTGYLWEVSGQLDAAVIKASGEPGFQKESGLIGAGGTQTNQFEAVAPGQLTLTMVYHRPWEKGTAPEKTFAVTVVVQTAQPAREISLTKKDDGAAVEMTAGEALHVSLAANPTTGFTWEAVPTPNAAVLAEQGEAEYKPESSLEGAPGVLTLTFKAVGPGQVKLALVDHQPWDKDTPPAETFTVSVTVKAAAEPALTLTERDDGGKRELKAGQRVLVLLNGNPTTGYTWQVDSKVDSKVLRQIGEPGFHQDAGLTGAGGIESVLFEAAGPGATTLSLSYARPWETGSSPEKTFTVHVTVTAK